MPKKVTNKVEKVAKPKAVEPKPEKVEIPPVEEPKESVLPIVDGSQAIEIIEETETATHYKLANGTTTWVAKKVVEVN